MPGKPAVQGHPFCGSGPVVAATEVAECVVEAAERYQWTAGEAASPAGGSHKLTVFVGVPYPCAPYPQVTWGDVAAAAVAAEVGADVAGNTAEQAMTAETMGGGGSACVEVAVVADEGAAAGVAAAATGVRGAGGDAAVPEA